MSDTPLDPTFAHYYARAYDCSLSDAVARIALAEAMRPHFDALRSMMRQRFAAHIDNAAHANLTTDSTSVFVWRGRAQEANEITNDFEHHLAMIEDLGAEYAARVKESQEAKHNV